jgi:hypothetical protein
MPIPKKRLAALVALHTALAETDPSNTSLILIKRAGYRAASTPRPLRRAPCQAAHPPRQAGHARAAWTGSRLAPALPSVPQLPCAAAVANSSRRPA